MDKYKELYDGLSEDQKAKVATCKTGEELVSLAEKEGIELTDDQLDVISGGSIWSDMKDGADESGWF